MTETERIALQSCVLKTSHIPGDCVEIGSLNGLSALLAISVMRSDKTLYCVEYNQIDSLRGALTLWQFMVGAHRVEIVNQDFHNVCFDGAKFSFAFIDHSHSYNDNILAFEKLWPKVSPGGIIAFHDYKDLNWVDGTRAIDELIVQNKLLMCDTAGSFIAFQKP